MADTRWRLKGSQMTSDDVMTNKIMSSCRVSLGLSSQSRFIFCDLTDRKPYITHTPLYHAESTSLLFWIELKLVNPLFKTHHFTAIVVFSRGQFVSRITIHGIRRITWLTDFSQLQTRCCFSFERFFFTIWSSTRTVSPKVNDFFVPAT